MRPIKRDPGGEDPFANLPSDKRALLRAGQLHPSAFKYEEGNEDLFEALGALPFDQFVELRKTVAKAKEGARGIRGEGFGEAMDFLGDVDLSAIAPLRESAGLSKVELLDRVLEEVPDISSFQKGLLKQLLRFKSFRGGGRVKPLKRRFVDYDRTNSRGVNRRAEWNNPYQGRKKPKTYASYRHRKGPHVKKELRQDVSGDNKLRVQKRKVTERGRRRVHRSVDRDRNVSTKLRAVISRATAPRHRTKKVFVDGELKKVVKKGRGVKRSVKRYK